MPQTGRRAERRQVPNDRQGECGGDPQRDCRTSQIASPEHKPRAVAGQAGGIALIECVLH
jgi:hypothetical protein